MWYGNESAAESKYGEVNTPECTGELTSTEIDETQDPFLSLASALNTLGTPEMNGYTVYDDFGNKIVKTESIWKIYNVLDEYVDPKSLPFESAPFSSEAALFRTLSQYPEFPNWIFYEAPDGSVIRVMTSEIIMEYMSYKQRLEQIRSETPERHPTNAIKKRLSLIILTTMMLASACTQKTSKTPDVQQNIVSDIDPNSVNSISTPLPTATPRPTLVPTPTQRPQTEDCMYPGVYKIIEGIPVTLADWIERKPVSLADWNEEELVSLADWLDSIRFGLYYDFTIEMEKHPEKYGWFGERIKSYQKDQLLPQYFRDLLGEQCPEEFDPYKFSNN